MKLKMTDDGYVALSDKGLPIWIAEDGDEPHGLKPGEEVEYEVPKLVSDLKRANSESAGRRKKIEELESELKELEPFKGFDIEAARKALETVKNYDAKELVDAGEVEKLKKAWEESYEDKMNSLRTSLETAIQEKDSENKRLDGSIKRMIIRSIFDNSKYLADKTVITPDIAFSHFGDHFVVKYDNKGDPYAVAQYKDGQEIYSKGRPGELANPEEAIEAIIDKYPYKERILKGTSASGSGSAGSSSGQSSGEEVDVARAFYPTMEKTSGG